MSSFPDNPWTLRQSSDGKVLHLVGPRLQLDIDYDDVNHSEVWDEVVRIRNLLADEEDRMREAAQERAS